MDSRTNQVNGKPPLMLYNSFTRKKEVFSPRNGNTIKWYNCGPTVYDSSHMGHARSYVTFDIIRRILQDYFGYSVFFVQNVTDIDDKIIKRARQSHLFDKLLQELKDGVTNRDLLYKYIEEGIQIQEDKFLGETDLDKKKMYQNGLEKAKKSRETINALTNLTEVAKDFRDILMESLDSRLKNSVTDNSVFAQLPKRFEDDYNEDMASLNVLRPNCVTRVSEYVPEIIVYIQEIIKNGYGYVSNGSVYFDVMKFKENPKHRYAKLVPEAVGDSRALSEGEGDLFSSSTTLDEKRSRADFVLWKKSKEGEPSWQSDWGRGRPGWHIECSVMACAILGDYIDIHSGGIDLRFPHHDNEVAQSEAFYDTGNDWIGYFLHSGHLTIEGCKMSKSLKNFKTIKDELKEYSKRQIRLAFLLHPWHQTLNYSTDALKDAVSLERYIFNFFSSVKHIIRTEKKEGKKWSEAEIYLKDKFLSTQESVDLALRDNLDTKTALDSIKDLINSWNIYEKSRAVHVELTEDVAQFVSKVLKVFGVIDSTTPEANFGNSMRESSSKDSESIVMPFLDVLANFRLEMRSEAIKAKNQDILTACDRLRDEVLPSLGVVFEDKDDKTVVKLVDRDTLMKELESKRKAEELKQQEKERRKREAEEKEARNRLPPQDWAKTEFPATDYSAFDDQGVPTHGKDGQELSKGQRKKFLKAFETQEKRYNDWQTKVKTLQIKD